MCSLPQKSIHALCLTSVSLQKGAASSWGEQHENRQNHVVGHFTIPKGLACPCTGRVKFPSAFIVREHMKLGGYSRFLSTLSHREQHWSLLHGQGQLVSFAGEVLTLQSDLGPVQRVTHLCSAVECYCLSIVVSLL